MPSPITVSATTRPVPIPARAIPASVAASACGLRRIAARGESDERHQHSEGGPEVGHRCELGLKPRRLKLRRGAPLHLAREERRDLSRGADHPLREQVEDPVADGACGFADETAHGARSFARRFADAAGDCADHRDVDVARGAARALLATCAASCTGRPACVPAAGASAYVRGQSAQRPSVSASAPQADEPGRPPSASGAVERGAHAGETPERGRLVVGAVRRRRSRGPAPGWGRCWRTPPASGLPASAASCRRGSSSGAGRAAAPTRNRRASS